MGSTSIDYLRYLEEDPELLSAHHQYLYLDAKATLRIPYLWQAVQKLATALLKEKYIGGKRARQIIKEAIRAHKHIRQFCADELISHVMSMRTPTVRLFIFPSNLIILLLPVLFIPFASLLALQFIYSIDCYWLVT